MGYLTIMNGKSGQNGFSAVGFSILGQPPNAYINRQDAGAPGAPASRRHLNKI